MSKMRLEVASRRIESFGKRFGEAHLYLAYHAAFPLALTPDLLYRLWANFQRDIYGEVLGIPWIAVADLLLSSLCDEVGHELYEMDVTVRNILLSRLKKDERFSLKRIYQLSDFLLEYVQPQLSSDDPDIQDFAQAQQWMALAYARPSEATHKLARALSSAYQNDRSDLLRLSSLVETLAEPLTAFDEFQRLFIYACGMENFARGNLETATSKLSEALNQRNHIKVAGINLPIPKQLAEPLRKNRLPQSQKQQRQIVAGIALLILFIGLGYVDLIIKWSSKSTSNQPKISEKSDSQTLSTSNQPKISEKLDSQTFAEFYKQAHASYKVRDYEQAIKKFSQAIEENPNYAKAYVNRGNAHYNIKEYESALADYNQALNINPQEVKAYVNRGNSRFLLAEYSSDPDREYNLAISDYNSALRLNPGEVEAYVRRGIVRAQIAKYNENSQQDYNKAIEDFNKALALSSDRSEPLFQRGVVRYQFAQGSSDFKKEYKQAIEDFNQALRINPKLSKVYLKRGIVRYELAQYGGGASSQYHKQAVEDLQTASRLALEQEDMDNYQQALSSICVVVENKCDTFLQTTLKPQNKKK